MAKIYHKEFRKKLEEKNKILWTNEPKHENKFKSNLNEKRSFFKEALTSVLDNEIIKNAIDLTIFVQSNMDLKILCLRIL